MQRSFDGDSANESEIARFAEISIPAHERLDAPRVGQDAAANDWLLKAQGATTPDEVSAALRHFEGYYVVALVACDGVPKYSHGGLYDGVDETSFRGSALDLCGDVLDRDLIEKAWNHKFPEVAVEYGQLLLAAAEAATARGPALSTPPKKGLLARLGLARPTVEEPFEEQLRIVEAAGRWFVFWGERGHAIRAWS
jgi:hypothetical protein